jgi:hypothetical protein
MDADALALSAMMERQIRDRWEYWRPWATMFARRAVTQGHSTLIFPPSRALDQLRAVHRRTVIECLAAGLRWETIRKRRLDDPRLDDETRTRKIQESVTKRARGISGRTKETNDHRT